MIDRNFAKEQIARIAQLKGFPRGETKAIAELVNAIQCAERDAEATLVIDGFLGLGASGVCPTPPDIRRAVFASIEAREDTTPEWMGKPIEGLCPDCESWGWVRGEDGVYKRCHCRSGHELPQNLLDGMNRKPIPVTSRPTGIREAEVARILGGER